MYEFNLIMLMSKLIYSNCRVMYFLTIYIPVINKHNQEGGGSIAILWYTRA